MIDEEVTLERQTSASACHVPPAGDVGERRIRRFWTWLQEQGVTAPAMEVTQIDGMRGVCVTEAIKEGSLLIHVPHKLVITPETAKSSWSGKVMTAMGARLSSAGYMAVFLLEIKRDGGLWTPYVDVLPESFPNHPVFFSAEELEYLRGSPTLRLIEERRQRIDSEYEAAVACFPSVLKFTKAEFGWAHCCVTSRSYSVRLRGERSSAMVPGADMLNHSSTPNMNYVPEMANGFTVTAKRGLAAGEQALESYGPRSSGDLFTVYGFCLPDNPYTEAQIEMAALKDEHPFYEPARSLGRAHGESRRFALPKTLNITAMSSMFSFLRLGCAVDLPNLYAALAAGARATELPPISRSNEVAALRMLSDACQSAMKAYGTTIEEDDDLLAGGTLDSRLRSAVLVRRSEKLVLQGYLQLTKDAIAVLESAGDLRSLRSQDRGIAGYFEHLAKHLSR